MRPVKIKMTAFGPYPSTEEIRFKELGENPLFLINGPTGSGKTTILDAICFALYGKSTGDEREGNQMRCDLSEPDVLTEVVLEFELGGKTFKIKRVPEQQRPKSRGEGFTEEKARAELIEILVSGEQKLIVASKVKEATAEIEKLTGLNADQFRQVMVLPQGKFRQLLMANSGEREQIFSNLFQTRIYKRLEEILKERSAGIKAEVEEFNKTIRVHLEAVGLESKADLEKELKVIVPKYQQAVKNKKTKDQAFLDASKNLQSAKNLVEQFDQLDETNKKLEELTKQKPGIEKKSNDLQQSEKANIIKPVRQELSRCQAENSSAAKNREISKSIEGKARTELVKAEQELKNLDTLQGGLDILKQELNKLSGYEDRAANLSNVQKSLEKALQTENDLVSKVASAAQALDKTTKLREQTESVLRQMQQSLSSFSQQQLALQELEGKVTARLELETKRSNLTDLRANLLNAERHGKQLAETDKKKENELKTLELKWHHGQAAILAGQLEVDQPCPVCGSIDHPKPAENEDNVPSQQELESARKSKQAVTERLIKAREDYKQVLGEEKSLQGDVLASEEKLGPYAKMDLKDLKKQQKELSETVHSLTQQQKQAAELESKLVDQKKEEQKLSKETEDIKKEHSDKKEEIAGIKARVDAAMKELPEEFRQSDALRKSLSTKKKEIKKQEQAIDRIRKNHQEKHGELQSAIASLDSANDIYKKASEALKQAEANWCRTLEKSNFPDEEAFEKVLLDEAVMKNIKQELENYQSQVTSTNGALAHQKKELEGKQKPDLKQLEENLEKLAAEKAEVEKIWQDLDKRHAQLNASNERLEKAALDKKVLESKYALIGTLSDVANGQTGKKISLQRFVLSVLLDDVLIEASHRLKAMSKGRYQLLRVDEGIDRRKVSGLDLAVEDAYSGKVRPVATLSGGESFMAALSMALGLSDVVQSYAGGIRLDTLFIDEGFGSLDQESLDLAIRTLVDLQSTGRMIGVISHVAELKEQLPLRLDIIATRNGSRLSPLRNI